MAGLRVPCSRLSSSALLLRARMLMVASNAAAQSDLHLLRRMVEFRTQLRVAAARWPRSWVERSGKREADKAMQAH